MLERARRGARRPDREFTAEIAFGGLSTLLVCRPASWDPRLSRGPRKAKDLLVLMVNTNEATGECASGYQGHRHHPRLTYYADDHLGLRPQSKQWPDDYRYCSSPEGREVVSLDLSEKHVRIIPPYNYWREWSTLRWCQPMPSGVFPDAPVRASDNHCLDWVLRGDQIGFGEPKLKNAVTTIELPEGDWRSRGVYRNREVSKLNAIRWYLTKPEAGQEIRPQTMGPDLLLVLTGLQYGLTIRISDRTADPKRPDPYDIVLTPGWEKLLRVSLTNLPYSYSEPDTSHVKMYSSLSCQDPDELWAPVQADDVVCAQSACNQLLATARNKDEAPTRHSKGRQKRHAYSRAGGGT